MPVCVCVRWSWGVLVSESQNNYLASFGTQGSFIFHRLLSLFCYGAIMYPACVHCFSSFVPVKKVSRSLWFRAPLVGFCSSAAMVESSCSCCPGNLHCSPVGVFQWFGSWSEFRAAPHLALLPGPAYFMYSSGINKCRSYWDCQVKRLYLLKSTFQEQRKLTMHAFAFSL